MIYFRWCLILTGWLFLTSQGVSQVAFWQEYMGGKGYDRGKKVFVRSDGTLILAGNIFSINKLGEDNHSRNSDFVIYNYATQGTIFWKRTYGGSEWDEISEIIQTRDNGFFCIGSTTSNDGDITESYGGRDVWVLKLDIGGNIEWTRTFGGKGDDKGYTVIETNNGEFLIGGESGSVDGTMRSRHHGSLDSWLARLDADGNFLWEKHFGGTGNEKVNRIHEVESGKFLVFNSSDSNDGDIENPLGKKDCWVFGMDRRGEINWQINYGGTDNDDIFSTVVDKDGNIVIAGTTFSKDGHVPKMRGLGDFWVFKISPLGLLHWSKTFGGRREDGANHVIQTEDGNYAICGMTKSRPASEIEGESDIEFNYGYYDGWLIKLNQEGNRMWSRTLGYAGADGMEEIVELEDGGFLSMGYSQLPRKSGFVPGHNGSSDFWLVNFGDPGKPTTRAYVTPPLMLGSVKDKDTGKMLEANITLTDNRTLDSLSSTTSSPEDGKFVLGLPAYGLASINVLTPGYLFYGEDIFLDTLNNKTSFKKEIALESIRIGSSLILKNIYFNAGKWDLLETSYAELERVVAFMKLNPRVQILVSGHTDNTGNKNQKVELSLNRAKEVKKYLVKQGIRDARMRVKGYGMYRPIATNKTAEGRQKNRRVEFEVINK